MNPMHSSVHSRRQMLTSLNCLCRQIFLFLLLCRKKIQIRVDCANKITKFGSFATFDISQILIMVPAENVVAKCLLSVHVFINMDVVSSRERDLVATIETLLSLWICKMNK